MRLLSRTFIIGEHPAGIDLVDSHGILTKQRVAEIASERHKGTFAHRIAKQIWFSAVGIDAADIQHSAFRLTKVRQRCLYQKQRRQRVDCDRSGKAGGIDRVNRTRRYDRGIIDNRIELPECRDGQIDLPP